jgi:hypothetical protein
MKRKLRGRPRKNYTLSLTSVDRLELLAEKNHRSQSRQLDALIDAEWARTKGGK